MGLKLWILHCVVLLAGRGQSVIYNCSSGKMAVTEDSNISIHCGPYSIRTSWSFWNNGVESSIGHCEHSQCYPSPGSPYTLQATSTGENESNSEIYIKNINRYQALDFVCHDTYLGINSSCKLRITLPPIVVAANCSLQQFHWYVHGFCEFYGMYDSGNNYTCMWSRNDDDKFLTEIQGLEKYHSNKKEYVKGRCYYNQSIPINTGNYRYSVSTSTGQLFVFPTNIRILVPVQPEHNCTEIVPEGSDITCTCQSSLIGNPAATVVWDGLNSRTLFLPNVQRENNSVVYTCRLTWGPVAEAYAGVNKPGTQPPIARHSSPSGDLYTIASTTTVGRASDESPAVCQMIVNEVYVPVSNDELQANKAAHQTKDLMQSDTAAPEISEDEYNVLQFEQDRPLQDDQTGNYHHIQLQEGKTRLELSPSY